MAYTCARCVQKKMMKPTFVENVDWPFLGEAQIPRLRQSKSVDSLATMTMSDCTLSSTPASPCSFSWLITPATSQLQTSCELDVVVSQYRSQKLYSVCSLLVDYLDCVGGAIVLVQDQHLWVVAHKGLHSRVLHDPTFLSICSRALSTEVAVTVPDFASSSSFPSTPDPSTFQFFGASPLFDVRKSAGPALGCLVALDTRARAAAAAYKMEITLENLADHVMDLLAQDKTILRIYASGDFKIFASAAEDNSKKAFDTNSSSSSTGLRSSRPNSFASRDEFGTRNACVKTDAAACRNAVSTALLTSSLQSRHTRRAMSNSRSVSTLKAA